MDTKKYLELTGIEIAPAQEAAFKANARRAKKQLETALGFTLHPENLYNELGKARLEYAYPNVDISDLLPADEELGTYKLFSFNRNDRYFHVDPFTNLYRVKLVMPRQNGEFITVKTLENVSPVYIEGVGKFIEKYPMWFERFNTDAGLQLAVEADWLDCYPDDLMYLWADMITHRSNPKRNIKSESVEGHSWSFATVAAPEAEPDSIKLLQRYAGPNSKVAKPPVS